MTTNILTNNCKVSDKTKEYIEESLGKLSQDFNVDPAFRLRMKSVNDKSFECKIAAYFRNYNYRVSGYGKNVSEAFLDAMDKLRAMVNEVTDTRISKKMKAAQENEEVMKNTSVETDEDSADFFMKVTRTKEVGLTPMSDDEAMEMLMKSKYDMYLYLDEATMETKGIYERGKGFGVIYFKNM